MEVRKARAWNAMRELVIIWKSKLPSELKSWNGGGVVLPVMDYTGRLWPKGIPISGWRYIKGYRKLSFRYLKGPFKISRTDDGVFLL